MKNLKKEGKILSIDKGCEVEVSLQEDGFKGSWFRAILEQNPTRVKGEKLRVCYKTLLHKGGVNPCKETIERCFIRPVPPECMNEGVVFKEGSVVDAYFNNGWWTGVIVVERPDGSFFVYFDEPPYIMRFIRSQLRPHTDWIGYKWVKSKNKVLSQHMFRTGKLVEMTREISDSEKEKIGPSPPRDLCAEYSLNHIVEVDAVFNYTEIRLSMEWLGGGSWIHARKREFGNNAATPIRSAQESPSNTLVLEFNEDDTVNDDATEITSSRESHNNTSGLEATETEKQNHETVDGVELPLPHESDDMMDDVATPIIDPQEIPRDSGVYALKLIECHAMRIVDLTKLSEEKIASIREKLAREFGNNAATPIRSAQESPSNTIVLESNEDDTVNDDATEITSSRESHSNTSVLEATETEKQNDETLDGVVLPLPHESDDMMDDVATP
ncbi:hypothetical protein F2Q69_00052942 [Brassica cretica]|uniref:Agenet domain-containing protein n=1 Tax=Brassica cretica TaxID=69181 RepID=A0A8S9N4W6_BRACR|nr:hypothetical protein F2Q69_00052942 [Brassica cretica]